eukprot:GHVU01086606.1.p2 GENE.GHVU01086606.1~~GHVU01086606.1.p2  ORF type:complete len:104 (+),score=20.17 GHVU01086606.1:722-1033(+)
MRKIFLAAACGIFLKGFFAFTDTEHANMDPEAERIIKMRRKQLTTSTVAQSDDDDDNDDVEFAPKPPEEPETNPLQPTWTRHLTPGPTPMSVSRTKQQRSLLH